MTVQSILTVLIHQADMDTGSIWKHLEDTRKVATSQLLALGLQSMAQPLAPRYSLIAFFPYDGQIRTITESPKCKYPAKTPQVPSNTYNQ